MNDPALLIAFALAVVFLASTALAWARASSLARRLAVAEERLRHSESGGELLKAQTAMAAQAVASQLVERAEATFKSQEEIVLARMANHLQPVAASLAKFEEQVAAMEKARTDETGGLKQQISDLLTASVATQEEARKLSNALRRGAGVQGRWGEQMLRNVLEAAGLQHRFDFDEQPTTETEEGRRRPDVIVRLAGGGVLVIDAKCSLNAFQDAQNAPDEEREAHYIRHAQSVKDHIRGLSTKAYWDQFERSPDVVVMFLPGDGYLAAALERLPNLMVDGMAQKVVIATPTTLFALCKVVAHGWRIEDQAEHAKKVAAMGQELYKRLSVMGGHVVALGKSLEGAVTKFNAFVGSLDSQVLTQARRFEDFAVDHQGHDLPQLQPIDIPIRSTVKLVAGTQSERIPPP